jgi:RNA polymerase sigma factor for flagellar operon FliA
MLKRVIMDDDGIPTDELWQQYRHSKATEIRNRLVARYLYLVKMASDRVAPDLPGTIDREELMGAGVLGLMQAIEKYDDAQGARFETYCVPRIRGAILDELRNFDWMPRLLRSKAHRVRETYSSLVQVLGRAPTDQEIAGNLGLSNREYNIIAMHASSPAAWSLDSGKSDDFTAMDFVRDYKAPNPAEVIEKREMREVVTGVIKSLPSTDRLVILLYYYDRLTMKQIGEVLRITESRICQVHNEVLAKLHRRLRARMEESAPGQT